MADQQRDLDAKKRQQYKRLVTFGEHMTERRGRERRSRSGSAMRIRRTRLSTTSSAWTA